MPAHPFSYNLRQKLKINARERDQLCHILREGGSKAMQNKVGGLIQKAPSMPESGDFDICFLFSGFSIWVALPLMLKAQGLPHYFMDKVRKFFENGRTDPIIFSATHVLFFVVFQ